MEILTGTSVLVSWNSLTIPNVQEYRVYYRPTQTGHSEEFVTVSRLSSYAIIAGLRIGLEYQFQVVAMIAENENVIMGGRSVLDDESTVNVLQGK